MFRIYKTVNGIMSMVLLIGLFNGCAKVLDVPSDKSLAIPRNAGDLQALMDRDLYTIWDYPSADEESSDDLYLTGTDYRSISENADQQRYLWAPYHIFKTTNEWMNAYRAVNTMNIVLESVEKFEKQNQPGLTYVKGQALVWRATRFLEVAKIWTMPYDAATATSDLGIPIRLQSDFNIPSYRSTLQETYDRILRDLHEAVPLLTENPISPMRPSRQAAYGMLARVYLGMRNYDAAGRYADSCLLLRDALIDYNTVNTAAVNPFTLMNKEVVFHFYSTAGAFLNPNMARVPQTLYAMYQMGDLRREAFYLANNDGSFRFKGSYLGTSGGNMFKGITTAEMYLIRAEAHARAGRTTQALADLRHLINHRWDNTLQAPDLTAGSEEEAISLVLDERRRELVRRGLRWDDIRRLNKEGYEIVQERVLDGTRYVLPPNDLRYALAIPDIVLERSSIEQNPR